MTLAEDGNQSLLMYAENQLFSHFLLILKPATFYKSLPFVWNKKTKQIESAFVTQREKYSYKIKCNLHVALTVVIIIQVALTNSQNPATKAMCTFTVAMLTLTTVIVKEYSTKDEDAISILNRFILSSKQITESMDAYERHRKMAVDLLNPGTFFFPLLYTLGVALRSPCLPSNCGFWMLSECSNNMNGNNWNAAKDLILKSVLTAINFWIWSFGMHTTVVVGSGIVMIGAMHFRCRLKAYHRQMLKISSDHGKRSYPCALIYREIQILSQQYNFLHKRAIIIAIIVAVVSTQSVCIYALVEFHMQMHWINKIFFSMMGLDSFMAIVMLCGTLADVFDVSGNVLNQLKRQHRGCKWLYRFHKSCQIIKMRFGMTNFMEKLTPLNFENFSLCQTVNMLLVKD